MKKRLVVLLALTALSLVLFAGCADGTSSDGSGAASKSVAPPSWIIGTWTGSFSGVSITYQFTSNDILMTSMGYTASLLDSISSISEDIVSDSEYKITYTDDSGTDSDHFVKVTDTTLTLDSVLNLTKQ